MLRGCWIKCIKLLRNKVSRKFMLIVMWAASEQLLIAFIFNKALKFNRTTLFAKPV